MHDVISRRTVLATGAALSAQAFAPAVMAQPPKPLPFDWKLHRPQEVGMSKAGLDAVRAAIVKHIDNQDYTGVVAAIARHNKLVWFEALGTRDPETGAPMRKDDIFRMMSSSKGVTSVAVMMMSDAGKLSIDDPVSRYIPQFKSQKVATGAPAGYHAALADPARRAELARQVRLVPASHDITIKELLTHTSGLDSADTALGPGPGALVNEIRRGEDETLTTHVPKLGSIALDFEPGTKFAYSPGSGMDTLLRVVEIVSGQPADIFLRERLFEPLQMRDTFFNIPPAKRERLLALYERQEGGWRPARGLVGYAPTKYFSGAGGLMSTVHDFMQFEVMLRNRGELNGKRILKPETVDRMSSNQVGDKFARWVPGITDGQGFGLGFGITLDTAVSTWGRGRGAFGWGGAYGTESWVDPELDVTAVYFVQQPVRPALIDFQRALRSSVVA